MSRRVPISDMYFINPEGHTGLAYPDYGLCNALSELGIDITYVTCKEYPLAHLPHSFKVACFFIGETKLKVHTALAYMWKIIELYICLWHKHTAILYIEAPRIPLIDLLFFLGVKARGLQLVLMIHDVCPLDTRLRLFMLPALYRLANKLVVFTQNAKAELIERYGICGAKITIVPQGSFRHLTQTHQYSMKSAREELRIPASGKVILSFGVLRKSKGQSNLVSAMPSVIRAIPEAILVVAGKSTRDEQDELENLISQLGIEDNVLLDARFIPDEELPVYFAAADLVALPYLSSYHSSVLEVAYSFGKPIVASRVGGLIECVEEGKTGLLVTPGDVQELADSLICALEDNDTLSKMGRAAYEYSQKNSSWMVAAQRLITLHQSL